MSYPGWNHMPENWGLFVWEWPRRWNNHLLNLAWIFRKYLAQMLRGLGTCLQEALLGTVTILIKIVEKTLSQAWKDWKIPPDLQTKLHLSLAQLSPSLSFLRMTSCHTSASTQSHVYSWDTTIATETCLPPLPQIEAKKGSTLWARRLMQCLSDCGHLGQAEGNCSHKKEGPWWESQLSGDTLGNYGWRDSLGDKICI